ncbi:MAG: hypothetical protein IKH57_07335 [Clostridia bacterium]|nr:hypothetical protein [Clostridia bacterium]
MKKGKAKKILIVVLGILALFVLVNVGWFGWRLIKYKSFSKGMDKNIFDTWIVPRYVYTDADDFDFGVKYPDYLTFTGNLSVGMPATEDNMFTDCLIIWPKFFGGYEYGVIIYTDEGDYQFYINADGSAVSKEDSETVARYRETIDILLRKAKEKWKLE